MTESVLVHGSGPLLIVGLQQNLARGVGRKRGRASEKAEFPRDRTAVWHLSSPTSSAPSAMAGVAFGFAESCRSKNAAVPVRPLTQAAEAACIVVAGA